MAAAEDVQSRLDVGASHVEPGQRVRRRGGGGVRCVRGLLGPGSVATDERGQDVLDLGAIRRRVPRHPFKCVDPADPNVDVLAADLVDGAREALGDLPFTVDLDLTPGGHRAGDDE